MNTEKSQSDTTQSLWKQSSVGSSVEKTMQSSQYFRLLKILCNPIRLHYIGNVFIRHYFRHRWIRKVFTQDKDLNWNYQ